MIGIQGEIALDEVTKSPADAALSTTSTNSVQNKVVTGEINELKDSLTNKADKTQLPQRITDSFTPTKISGNISYAIAWVYVFGYVETILIKFTLSASVPAGTELISLQNMATNPHGFVPINFVRYNVLGTYEGYVNGAVNKIVALEDLPADTYEFSYTYVV